MKVVLRQLLRSPGFSLVAVLMLALGIGFSTSSFSLANTFLLRNVPYPDADRLVRIFGTSPQTQQRGHAPGNILDVRAQATSFASMALYNFDSYALGEPGQPAEQVGGMAATANFFTLLGVQPVLGRGFTPDEDQPEKPLVAVITHRAWTRRYASDPNVIGRTIRINTEPHTIIGVLPPEFDAPLVWGPVEFVAIRTIHPEFHANRTDAWMQAVARLKPEATLQSAGSELATIAARLAEAYPRENGTLGLRVVELHDSNMDGVSRMLLWLMTGLSVATLLIACANLASLQIARAFARSREFAVRAAIGGGRRHLMYPLLLESLTLAAIGGGLSLFVAWWSNRIIGGFLLINNERGYELPLDVRVLAFAFVAAVVSGIAFGLAPAWIASRSSAAEALKAGGRSATASRAHQFLKRSLITAELAIALALVGVAAAFGLGARSIVDRDVGWDMNGLFAGRLALPYNRYNDQERNREFLRNALQRLSVLPGVEQAVLATGLPVFSVGGPTRITIEGRAPEEPGREPVAEVASVSGDYFSALRIPLRQGRTFPSHLTERDPAVLVVNEAFARRFWPDGSAIGRRVRFGDDETWHEIIGVVGDVRGPARLEAPATRLQAYRSIIQAPSRYFTIALRTAVAPESLTPAVRHAIAAIDGDVAVADPGSVRENFLRNMSNLNLVIINLGISAGMGLLIATVGLFGVIAQLTVQRTRDIGVRMALGAQARDVLRLIMGEGLRVFVLGAVIGIPLFYAATMLLHQSMPELQLPGLWLLGVNLLVLGTTTFVASYLPAVRATRINPVEALRAE